MECWKNKILQKNRNITFDEIIQAISDGYGVSDVSHWNKERYANQRVMTVMVNGYAYLVPICKRWWKLLSKNYNSKQKSNHEY